jgi:hypothetical protein
LVGWIVVESKFSEVKYNALSRSGGKYVKRGDGNLGPNAGHPTIQRRIRPNDLVVTKIKRASDVEKSIPPPNPRVLNVTDDAIARVRRKGKLLRVTE